MSRKKEFVNFTVASIEDLVKVVWHNDELLLKHISNLARSNRRLKIFGMFAVGCAIYTALECRKLDEKTYGLSLRLAKLENKEGE